MSETSRLKTLAALATASATFGVSNQSAIAQEASTDQAWTVSVEGAVLSSDFATPSDEDFVPAKLADVRGSEDGFYGAVSIGRELSPDIDWRLSAAFSAFEEVDDSASAGTIDIASSDDVDYQTFDFDIGKKFRAGELEARFFGGIRGMHSEESASFAALDEVKLGSLETQASQESEFYGVGPRIGVDFYHGQAVGVAGSLSGAVIGGHRESSSSFTSSEDGIPTGGDDSSEDGFDWVGNISASLGVAARPSEGTMVTLGYRVDAWWNLRGETNDVLDRDEDVVTHGPFLKVQTQF